MRVYTFLFADDWATSGDVWDVSADNINSLLEDSLPDLEEGIEDGAGIVRGGDVTHTFRNDPATGYAYGFYTNKWNALDPTARYDEATFDGCWHLKICKTQHDTGTSSGTGAGTLTDSSKSWVTDAYRRGILLDYAGVPHIITDNNGTVLSIAGSATPTGGAYQILRVRWEGDLDVPSIGYEGIDGSACVVTATFRNTAARAERFNAQLVRRAIPQNTGSGTATDVGATYLEDTSGDTPITEDDQFNNHTLIDSAGNPFWITDTVLATGMLTLNAGTPAAGAYTIEPLVFTTDRVTYPRRFTSPIVPITNLELMVGDIITTEKYKTDGLLIGQEFELLTIGPNVATPALTGFQVQSRRRIKNNLQSDPTNTTCWCDTYYWRDQTIAVLVGKIFDHMGLTDSRDREIDVTAFTDNDLPYFDTEGKGCDEALAELVAISNAVYFRTPEKAYFISRDVTKVGGGTKALDSLLTTKSWGTVWEWYVNQVVVTGTDDRAARRGAGVYGGSSMDIQTDFTGDLVWLKQIAERNQDFFCTKRRPGSIVVQDDGTVYHPWDLVTVTFNGVLETFWVVRASEPYLSVASDWQSEITLEIVRTTGTAISSADIEDDQYMDDTDPEPPILVAYTRDYSSGGTYEWVRDYYTKAAFPGLIPITVWSEEFDDWLFTHRRLWFLIWTWEQDDLSGRLKGFHITRWHDGEDRDSPRGEVNYMEPIQIPTGAGAGYYVQPIYSRVSERWWCDVQAIAERGRHSAWSDPLRNKSELVNASLYLWYNAGTAQGIYKSLDGGKTWDIVQGMSSFPTASLMRGFAVSPYTGRLYVTYFGDYRKVWYSDDAGETFDEVIASDATGLSYVIDVDVPYAQYNGLCYVHITAQTDVAPVGFFAYKDDDGESSPWQRGTGDIGAAAPRISICDGDADFGMVYGAASLFVCYDAASSATPAWYVVRSAAPSTGSVQFAYPDPSPDHIGEIWFCLSAGLGHAEGGPWTVADTCLMDGQAAVGDACTNYQPLPDLAVCKGICRGADDRLILVGDADTGKHAIYYSDDEGQTWTGAGATDEIISSVFPHPNAQDYLIATGGAVGSPGVWVSDDNGETWTNYTEGLTNECCNTVATYGLFPGRFGGFAPPPPAG